MPRDSNGFYTLPLNPVTDGDIIEAGWANTTIGDIAVQLNNVITRDGLLGPTEALLLVNGSVSQPSLAFNTQANLGLYRDGVNALAVTANGLTVIRFSDLSTDALKPFGVSDGTALLPSLRFSSEADTGFYKDAENVLGIAVNGVKIGRFGVDGFELTGAANISGNVGIGGNLSVLGTTNLAGTTTIGGIVYSGVPSGMILDYAGPAVPTGYLLCDGTAVSRATYAALFAAIGGYWGAGDGSTTFNVPDLRRYVTMGSGGTKHAQGSGPNTTVGSRNGFEATSINTLHMPSHTHGNNAWQDAHNHGIITGAHNHGVNDPGHQHRHQAGNHVQVWQGHLEGYGTYGGGTPDDAAYLHKTESSGVGIWLNAVGDLGGYTDTRTPGVGVTIHANGSDVPFNNVQPSAVVNKIIKT